MAFLTVLSLLAAIFFTGECGFSYEGQKEWGNTCANVTGYQSPINVNTPDKTELKLDPLTVPEASRNVNMTVAKDDEHSVKVEFPESETEDFNDIFKFKIPTTDDTKTKALQLHLHWGRSEHLINFKQFAAECHLVTIREEVGLGTKLTVFARVFELGESNPELEKLITAAEEKAEVVEGFNLANLYPTTIRHVLTYTGSLTTPPCTEGVSWFVVQDPLTVSKEQVQRLQKLSLGNTGHALKSNFRFIQALNNRTITRWDLTGGAGARTVSWLCFLLGIVLVSL